MLFRGPAAAAVPAPFRPLHAGAKNRRPHAEMIDIADLPRAWLALDATVDVEAKGKERAVLQLMREAGDLFARGVTEVQ